MFENIRFPHTGRPWETSVGTPIDHTPGRQPGAVPRTGPDGRGCESMKRFRLDETYAELKAAALSQNDLFDEPPAASGDNAVAESLDCDCTD